MQTEFQASVSPTLLKKCSRFFDNSFNTIIFELLQNSRRACASHISILVKCLDYISDKYEITIHDNGKGIDNPKDILTFGKSSWNDLSSIEDPAGIGFFSLSRINTIVSSNNWKIHLTPECFTGESSIKVEKLSYSFNVVGTKLVISFNDVFDPISRLKDICRYLPITISINGEMLEQTNFLNEALDVVEVYGINVGIFKKKDTTNTYDSNINFFGHTFREYSFPSLLDLFVKCDVTEKCTELEFKLPDRKGFVYNTFFSEFTKEIKRILYEYINSIQGFSHRLSYEQYKEGLSLGVSLPEAIPELKSIHHLSNLVSCSGRYGYVSSDISDIRVDSDTFLLESFDSIAQTFAMSDCEFSYVGKEGKPKVVLPDNKYCGKLNTKGSSYSWYNSIPKISSVSLYLIENPNEIHKEILSGSCICEIAFDTVMIWHNKDFTISDFSILPNLYLVLYCDNTDILYCKINAYNKTKDENVVSHILILDKDYVNKHNCVPEELIDVYVRSYFSLLHYSTDIVNKEYIAFRKSINNQLSKLFIGNENYIKSMFIDTINGSKECLCDILKDNKKIVIKLEEDLVGCDTIDLSTTRIYSTDTSPRVVVDIV